MKLFSIAAILAPSSISDAQDDFDPRTNKPDRKLDAIGEKIKEWTTTNLCNDEGRCLPAVDKPVGNWEQRIDNTVENLLRRFNK